MIFAKGTIPNLRPQILLKTFRTYLKDFLRKLLSLRLYLSLQIDEIWNLSKIFLRTATANFTRPLSRRHIFITKSVFDEQLSVAIYRSQNFSNYFSEIKFEDPSFGKFSMELFLLMKKL